MSRQPMTSMERVMTAITHKEPDRVPLFLLLSLYGAKELGMTVEEYFNKAENVVAAQRAMREKFQNDCYYTFFYASIETEAFGFESFFVENGPPNAGVPILDTIEDVFHLEPPEISESPGLKRVLRATEMLKERVGNEVPIIGVAMSPFSLPVMQIGFEKYLEMIYFRKEAFDRLMKVNEAFCVAWANAQLAAGATAICYFDPLASPTVIEKEVYMRTGNVVAKRTIAKIRGATATHLASGLTLPVVHEIAQTGTAVLGFGSADDPVALKKEAEGRVCLIGNLNGLEMVHWTREQARQTVKTVIEQCGKGGGFILSDGHGEVPWQVSEETLLAVSEAVRLYGTYPLK